MNMFKLLGFTTFSTNLPELNAYSASERGNERDPGSSCFALSGMTNSYTVSVRTLQSILVGGAYPTELLAARMQRSGVQEEYVFPRGSWERGKRCVSLRSTAPYKSILVGGACPTELLAARMQRSGVQEEYATGGIDERR